MVFAMVFPLDSNWSHNRNGPRFANWALAAIFCRLLGRNWMNMAIEIVDLPIRNGGFSIYIYTYMVFIVVKDAINQQQWEYDSYILVGGLEHDWIIFHFVYGMSSFPLTNSYFSRWLSHHQPAFNWCWLNFFNHFFNFFCWISQMFVEFSYRS